MKKVSVPSPHLSPYDPVSSTSSIHDCLLSKMRRIVTVLSKSIIVFVFFISSTFTQEVHGFTQLKIFQAQHAQQAQNCSTNNHNDNFGNAKTLSCTSRIYRNNNQRDNRFPLSPMSLKSMNHANSNNVNVKIKYNNTRNNNDENSGAKVLKIPYPNLCIIGICGSIGSGKSYTSSLLVSKLNSIVDIKDNKDETNQKNQTIAYHIDTDSLAHGVYVPGSTALKDIEQTFGKDVIQKDGTVNRQILGSIVFSNPQEMEKLEQIVWPNVKTLLLKKLDEINNQSMSNDDNDNDINDNDSNDNDINDNNSNRRVVVVVEAAVLLDANWDDNQLFDAIWAVRSSSQTTTQRLVQNRGMNEEDAIKRMEAQLSRRGIGNVTDELDNGTIMAIIENDHDCNENLWNAIRQRIMDPKSWKDGRFPNLNLIL